MESTAAPILGDRFEVALVLAHRLHRTQLRKGTQVPYLAHLLSVAALVLEEGGDEDEAIAALLHDAIEDQGGQSTRDLILAKFGKRVCDIVEGCTESRPEPLSSWQDRKVLHLAKLVDETTSVRMVTLADKLHNVRSTLMDYNRFGSSLWNRFGGGRSGTIWYYRAVASSLRSPQQTPILTELERSIDWLEYLSTNAEMTSSDSSL
jgi:(p)ppGpp synthase/HD superfamily hydrolase